MKYTFWGMGLIMAGLFGIVFIVMFENITINNESEYYVLKESVEAAMYESIDVAYWREKSKLKIIEEKFVANCTRRFYENITGAGKGYRLDFYDIMESPPKVTVVANSSTESYEFIGASDGFNIENHLSAIFELDEDTDDDYLKKAEEDDSI